MKILYAIQGTGNGHISRAREVAPLLEERSEVDYLVSGCQVDLPMPFPVKYRSRGLSLIFGKSGGVDINSTIRQSSAVRLRKEIRDLPVEKYDLVINDFEPVSAWAARKRGVRCVALSHQSALLSPNIPRPEKNDLLGRVILEKYAPADAHFGFHFDRYDEDIFTPIIRKDLREMPVSHKGHITVYLPAYDDKLIFSILSEIKDVEWQVFSKHGKQRFRYKNVEVQPIHGQKFVESMVSADGILCGAGFETPSEALFLGKKLMVIPMKNQYEQLCNARALSQLGIPVLRKLSEKAIPQLQEWVTAGIKVRKDYPDETEKIIDMLLSQQQ